MPYVGAGVLTSACGMDKIMTKYILQAAGIPQVPYVPVLKNAWKENPKKIFDQCEGSLLYPMFVKPANMGSSVGISKAENREELQNALQEAYRYDTRAIVEQGIEAREIEVAVLGNEDVRTTMPGEIVKDVAFMITIPNTLTTESRCRFLHKFQKKHKPKLKSLRKSLYDVRRQRIEPL